MAKVTATTRVPPMARPSSPSDRLTPLLVPTITSQIQGTRKMPTSGLNFLKKGTESWLVSVPRRLKWSTR